MRRKKENKSNVTASTQPQVETARAPQVDTVKITKDYFELMYHQNKIRDGLLGNFSADGKYQIENRSILDKLVAMPKLLGERVDNIVYASAKLDELVLNFKVTLDIAETYCSATLALIEIENKASESVKHITELGDLVEPYSPMFKENAYKLWNIFLEESVYDKNDFLWTYLQNMKNEAKFNKELNEILAQLYIMRMLKLLEKCGDVGSKVEVDYRLLVEQLAQKDPSITQNYTKLKQILDEQILKHNALGVILNTEGGAQIVKGYVEPLNRVRGKDAPVEIVEHNKPAEAKQEKPKVAGASKNKSAKKSKSAGGGKGYMFDWKNVKMASPGAGSATPPKPAEKKEEEKAAKTEKPAAAPVNQPGKDLTEDLTEKLTEEEYVNYVKSLTNLKKKGNQINNFGNEGKGEGAQFENVNTANQKTIYNSVGPTPYR